MPFCSEDLAFDYFPEQIEEIFGQKDVFEFRVFIQILGECFSVTIQFLIILYSFEKSIKSSQRKYVFLVDYKMQSFFKRVVDS